MAVLVCHFHKYQDPLEQSYISTHSTDFTICLLAFLPRVGTWEARFVLVPRNSYMVLISLFGF